MMVPAADAALAVAYSPVRAIEMITLVRLFNS